MRDWNSNQPPHSLRSRPTEDGAVGQRTLQNGEANADDSASPSGSPEAEPEKARFYKDLAIFIETEEDGGRNLKIKRRHRFQGVTFDLWDLYQTVLRQNCPVDDVDWELVAEDMDLDWVAGPEVAELLEGCWDKYLGKFHELTAGFAYETQEMDTVEVATSELEEEVEEVVEEVGEEEEVEVEAEEEVEEGVEEQIEEPGDEDIAAEEVEGESEEEDVFEKPSVRARQDQHRRHTMPALRERDSLLPSSPPVRGLPRPAHLGQSSPTLTDRHHPTTTTLLPSRKRSRFSLHSEIPSTPDSQLQPRAERHDAETPRKRRKLRHAEDISTMEPEPEEEEEEEYITPSRKPPLSSANKRASSSVAHRRVETGRAASSAVRRKTATTGVTKETRPAPSPHTPRRRGVRKTAQPRAVPQPERDSSAPPREEPEQEGEEDNSDEVFAAIERFEAQGYSRETVIEALYRTSMEPTRAGLVMESLKSGNGVPKNQRGVWTVRDDERLRTVDSGGRGIAKMRDTLLKKHGAATVDARRRFLADAEAIGFSL